VTGVTELTGGGTAGGGAPAGGRHGGRTAGAGGAEAPLAEREGPSGAGTRVQRLTAAVGPAVAIVVAQQLLFPAPAGIVLRGLIVGGLTALVALGMALVHRANRIINFAQADLGFAPAVLAYLLLDEVGVPWPAAVAVGLLSAVVLGGATERVVIRRFFRAPRLLVTIATIGLSQVLAAVALLLPRLWDRQLVSDRIAPPFDTTARIGGVVFDANDLLALVVTPTALLVVAVVLYRSAAGTAIRAAADDPDRASLLGVPVHRLHTAVWAAAAALAFVTVFLRGGILGLPTATVLGFSVLLRALVALVIGRLTNLVVVTTSAVALGVLEVSIAWEHSVQLVEPVLGVVLLVALVVQRRDRLEATGDGEAWQAAEEVRPVPVALAGVAVVRWARWGLLAAAVAAAAVLPHLLTVDRSLRASALVIYAVLGISLVLLSGWGGQVSLGHVAFFAIGAAVGGWVTSDQGGDLFTALVVATAAGAVAAAVVGIPASRLRGLALAVTTFAFSLATTAYLLNREFFEWVPRGRIERAPLLGGLEVSTPTEVYYLALAVLVLVALGARGIRASRTGRALVALRDNERAAQAYGVDVIRLRLATYALSGGVAALAGALFVHHQQAFDPSTYAPIQNLAVFTMVVVGGLTSVTGAVLGALFLLGTRWFLPGDWQILASGTGVLAVLWLAPGGLASVAFRGRDALLREVAHRRGITLGEEAEEQDDAAPSGGPTVGPMPDRAPSPPGHAPRSGSDEPVTVLAVEDLDVSYGSVPVLFGVDLRVAKGQTLALLGTNAAGKSTLLRAVSGLLRPRRGEVLLDGEPITGRPPHVIAALGVAHMPGGAGVFPSLTVAENLRTAGWLQRRDPDRLAESGAELHRLFPVLAERAGQRVGSLSGGEQQMLALAMVLLTRPRVLLIDELSLGLAPPVVGRLLAALGELRQGSAVVLVDQSVDVALEAADRAVFLERGRVRFTGSAADLLDRPDLLRSVFLGRALTGPGATGQAVPEPTAAAGSGADTGAATPRGPAVLEADGLSVAFAGLRAVQDATVAVSSGEIVGVIGPNGAGKTTLFDLLSGFLPPDGGRVRLAGRDITAQRPSARSRAGLARSFQDAHLFPSLTVEEAVATARERWVQVRDPLSAAFGLPNARASERAVTARVAELVALVGLERYRSSFVAELSTGTRRVLELACLLAHEPEVVLLDEPAAGLAQREVEALAPLIRRIRDSTGASLVVVEHDLALIESVADRLVAMDQGRIIATGPPGDVLADPVVVDAYLGPAGAPGPGQGGHRKDLPSPGG
jgi:branched-chain amino acid transport system permease protein